MYSDSKNKKSQKKSNSKKYKDYDDDDSKNDDNTKYNKPSSKTNGTYKKKYDNYDDYDDNPRKSSRVPKNKENKNYFDDKISEKSDQRQNKKRVKFAPKVTTIKVECWKKYNLEQTADENIDELMRISNPNDKNHKSNRDPNVKCTCQIY